MDYRLIKELWAFTENRIAVRYAYEWHDAEGNWYRSYGNENWEFEADGLMRRRFSCINDLPMAESERRFHWPLGRRPDDHPGTVGPRAVTPSTGSGWRPVFPAQPPHADRWAATAPGPNEKQHDRQRTARRRSKASGPTTAPPAMATQLPEICVILRA